MLLFSATMPPWVDKVSCADAHGGRERNERERDRQRFAPLSTDQGWGVICVDSKHACLGGVY